MIKLSSTTNTIGLERAPKGIKCAKLSGSKKNPSIIRLYTLNLESDDVKPLYKNHPILGTGLDGTDVLVRPLNLPLTKEKDILAALTFQAEPLLPYPAEEAVLTYQMIEKNQEGGSSLILLAARKDAVHSHIESWQALNIEPETVGCTQSALCRFGRAYLSNLATYIVLHVQPHSMTCVLIKGGKLAASFALQEGLDLLFTAQTEDGLDSLPKNLEEWKSVQENKKSRLSDALSKLQRGIIKMGFAFSKELRGQNAENIAITGEAADLEGLSEILVQGLPIPIMACPSTAHYSSRELLSYAVPIGLAIESLPGSRPQINFRQGELAYPHPWHRLATPLLSYIGAIGLLTLAFYMFSQHYLLYNEDHVKQSYVDLLANIGKTPEEFETAYEAKTPSAREKFSNGIPTVKELSSEDLVERINFIQKDLQSTPDSFPLFANIPRVSDVLAWLSQHDAVVATDESGQKQGRLEIESFNYTLVKRPQLGKKQEKYQVKIELEFSSPTPKWAREFHDALIAPNNWVDPKAEVKWNTNRGRYKTSFFLKDKTIYPSQ